MSIRIILVFCAVLLGVNAAKQPYLFVTNNNLHFQMPPEAYINFAASKVKLNGVDLLPTLQEAKNATKLLRNYESFISQFHSKMDDMESRILNLGYGSGNASNATTDVSANVMLRLRRLNTRMFALQRDVRRIQLLLTMDECATSPCKNGGTCFDNFKGFICLCPKGWEGPTCQVDINECARYAGTDLGCQNGGTCLNLPGTFQCQCPTGWIGMLCNRKPTDCNSGGSEICGHGTCIPQNNEAGYKCLCDSGWTTDGTHMSCTVDVDECKQNHPPCSTNPLVQCINLPGSFMCQHCPPGYTGNGYYCADINECELFNGGCSVSPYVECINTPGSKKCGLCPAGYEGDGKTCTFKGVCNVNNGGCSILARCVSNPAISETYVQCICPTGYVGSGIGPGGCVKAPSAITSCTPNPCVHGTCVANNLTEGFVCICNGQYIGTYCDYQVNPCATNPCLNGGTCIPRKHRFVCSCMNGFTGRLCQKERQACGENLNSPNGTISYPPSDFDSTRSSEPLSCAWTIRTQENKVLELTFTKFNFADPPCTSQWFQVHDGRNSLAPPLGRFCGKTLPFNGSLTTTNNVIYFWLRTNGQQAKKPEFEISWITKYPECGGALENEGIGMITSPGWPNDYPINRECFWTFSVPVNQRILFHVYSLNIGQDSDCSGDYLEFNTIRRRSVFHGVYSQQQFRKLCNSTIPEPFYSTYRSGTIYFKSNEKNAYGGFQIGYSVVAGIPGCGGTYTTKDGYINAVEMTKTMPSPLMCAYEIKLPVNTTIKIEFIEMDLESNCDVTNVAIYIESTSELSLLAKTCGNILPGPLITFGSNILIKSLSSYSFKSHWKIKYEAVCHQTYTKASDTINVDTQWEECRYLIQQPAGRIIILDLELSGYSYHGTSISIWDGDSENSTLIGQYSTMSQKVKVESTTNYLLIKITSRPFANIPQFTASYITMDLGCGGLLKNDLGTISYPPRGVEKYSSNKKCRWVIMAPPGKIIQLTWMTFNLEQSYDCLYDNLQIFDNNTDIGLGGLLGKYCGYTLPPVMLSSSNMMTLDFNSDNTIHGDGFLVSYTFINENNVCGGNYFTAAGVIKSPGFPEKYPTNRECVWTITVPSGSQIMLKFSNFSLESYSGCRYDWLEVRNGGTSSSPLIGKYCGNTYPKTIPSHTNKLYLKFNSDMSRTSQGFRLEWTSAATGCGGTLLSPSGSIMSPHYPEPYTKNTDCLWKITVSSGSKIQLIFADIDLEKHSACGLDFVQIFDGPTMNSKSSKYCSPQTNPVISSNNVMLVRFRSDVSFQGHGFNIQYSTICSNKLKGFRGVIESPNFPSDYPKDQDCVWDIYVSQGNKINITFSHFALERSMTLENKSCAFDYVEIEYIASSVPSDYTESDLAWQKYDRYCGDKNPGFITLNSNLARIHFVSDSLLLGTGFRLEWQLFGCGGTLTADRGIIESPNYPKSYPSDVICDWIINVPFGQSVTLTFQEIDVEKNDECNFDSIHIFNGKDDTYQEIATFCHQLKPVTVTSSGNSMFVRFKADQSYEGRGFRATYETTPTTCGGYLSAASGYIFSPNYPKNFNRNETCEWLIDTDQNHMIELVFQDIDLVSSADCEKNYIKVYDGTNQAYPVLETICGNTTFTNKTIRSTNEHMFVEFRSEYYFTSKGFKAQYKRACGAKIKATGSGVINFQKEFMTTSMEGDRISCNYTIEAEDNSKHVTFAITKLFALGIWCDDDSPALKFYNGPFDDSPLIAKYCGSKIPPPIISDGSALHIEVLKDINFFATYSVLNNQCGGDLVSLDGYIASPGWPKSYPASTECVWTVTMGPGNAVLLHFINFDIPESESCNTDFLEIRETNATGKLLGVYCGMNSPSNISTTGTLYLMFKSSRLDDGVASTKKGFYAEYATTIDNQLSGSEGLIGNQLYPTPYPTGDFLSYDWLITTNTSTIIELKFLELFPQGSTTSDCYGTVIKVYDGMDTSAPLLTELCQSAPPDSILSTSNMIYITVDYYSNRIDPKFLIKWKELSKRIGGSSNSTKSDCHYYIKLQGQNSTTFTSPGYPNGYGPSLNCEWIFESPPQYHLKIIFEQADFGTFGSYRICAYSDTVKVYTMPEKNSDWVLLKEFCNNSKTMDEIVGSNLMKVEFTTNKYLNGSGFEAKVYGVCGGTLTDPSGVIEFDKDHAHNRECQWNISVRAGRTIKLTFQKFDLGANDPNTCRNYLIVRNGKFPDSPFLGDGKFCGPDIPPVLESSSNHIYLKYNGFPRIKGFKIEYTEVSVDCGQDIALSIDDTSVEISSPNYPNIPPPHSECVWTIRAPPGESLRVDFKERFDIAPPNKRCTSNYVELRDGGTELSPLIGSFCEDIPPTQFTVDNMLRVKYFTDSNDPRNGFKAQVSITYCGGTLRGNGTISTKQPHTIRAGSNCTWHLKAPIDNYIILNFPLFQVGPPNADCNSQTVGTVTIYEFRPTLDGNNNVTLGVLCGRNHSTEIRSHFNEVIVNYLAKSDQDEFLLTYSFVREECGGTLHQDSGTIYSPGYPLMNNINRYCLWRIKVSEGRRISLYIEDMDIDPIYTFLLIFQGYLLGPRIVGHKDIQNQKTYETSDNGAHILFWQEHPSNKRGFKITFTSDKPTLCVGDFNATSGVISTPETSAPYRCEYRHSKTTTDETFAMEIAMKINTTKKDGVGSICRGFDTGIFVYSDNAEILGRICQSTNNNPVIIRSTYPVTGLTIQRYINTSLNFTVSFKTHQCGGIIEQDEGKLSSPNFPNSPQNSIECSWIIASTDASHGIKINFTTLDLGDDCNKNYVTIYNGKSPTHPRIGKYCKNNKPEVIVVQKKKVLIEYSYIKSSNNPSKGFSLMYEPELRGCGGLYQIKSAIIQTPNYGQHDYGNNEECIWDIQADEGNMIQLYFVDRFYIEESANCTKDYVEIFDWIDEKWLSIGKKCGRNLPGQLVSSSNKMRIMFRSNDKITGTGFRASWDWHCGGIFEAVQKERYLLSPSYPNTYMTHSIQNCTYKIVSKSDQGTVSIKFLDFHLGKDCAYTNLTITGTSSGRALNSIQQHFCGRSVPRIQRYKQAVIISFKSARVVSWASGFKMTYKDESCGGNITTPTALEAPKADMSNMPGILKFYQPKIACAWYITAPAGQIPILSIHNLSMSLGISCLAQSLEVYDGLETKPKKRLAQLCGHIEENKPIPSTSNTMLVKLRSTGYNFNGFEGEVYFTYGPSVGCGGTVNLTETKYINSPSNLPHMDCHWIIIAPRDTKVQLEFTEISISAACVNPVRNHTYYCTCSYVEVRDGGGPFADQMERLCSSDNHATRTLTTSWNTAYVRLYSAVPQNNMFRLTLKPVQSKCGASQLTATQQLQELTSPDYPNNYPEDIKCTWVIKSPTSSKRIMIHFEEFDFVGQGSSSLCTDDRLELTEDPNRNIISEGFGPTAKHQVLLSSFGSRESFKYSFCDNETKPFDYYSLSNEVTLTFRSLPYTGIKGRGFKLKYGFSGCSRDIYANEGRIQNDVGSSDEPNCTVTITAEPNRTISIYFMTFYFLNADSACTKTGLEIRENNSTGTEILKACGFRVPNPIFSNSNKLYIRTYNVPGQSNFFFKYNFLYISSEKGKGCGGKLFNYMGKFSSPMYPNPYREDIECTWDVMVPKGFKVALKISDFNIGGKCIKNKLVVKTYSESAETTHTFCPENVPALLFSDNILRVTYYSSTNNGGNGWIAAFQAVKEESNVLLWF